ncbi:phenylalanyl-tRNA synthetase alpha subunit, mitochondrial [Coemansia sp. Benny D115]|nr:phenylalanyl-tRNA synthetase alpha subunit, mitochondrial [Coemansia sp. Benny D115]
MLAVSTRRAAASIRPHCAIAFTTRLARTYSSSSSDKSGASTQVLGATYARDGWSNTTTAILEKTGRNLLHQPSHPLAILKELIFAQFPTYAHYDGLSPVVTTQQNFDSLGFAQDHPGRAKSDTYYLNETTLLRTHTSAHQLQLLRAGHLGDAELLGLAKNASASPGNERFLVAADVYRRDEIDASHYPVFHQMEGVCTFSRAEVRELMAQQSATEKAVIGADNPVQSGHSTEEAVFLATDMQRTMNRMVSGILAHAVAAQQQQQQQQDQAQPEFPVRWIDAFFPFTSPSWEMEVLFRGEWLEICGCGVMQQAILDAAGMPDRIGWAFGFGLERLAMLLFGVPDIRLFWSTDARFTAQFAPGRINSFRPFSRHPPCPKDVSFWLPEESQFHENDLMDLVRETAGDLVEDVKLVDSFTHPKTGRTSHCYRINYCSMDRNVTNEEINAIQDRVRTKIVSQLGVTLR